ncbi:hypothetical protein NY2A_b479L [Paramecium bursaria Chlorella virus NY2A]|uniref:Uncharacterized protein b479L n=1 Tax=Paramecium bursaria Chlorella virus NY2A TaxID=46021 RepID=A7IX04_PBCVN|nr:hypothetical protein NY2A_b479L [Paramecium bursaria Chlorella virus NY2A]ABT14878.1 hypothetical protein NY2A_b479L [Paramecium bursaria Chlorella virus NY2A]
MGVNLNSFFIYKQAPFSINILNISSERLTATCKTESLPLLLFGSTPLFISMLTIWTKLFDTAKYNKL